MAHVPWARHDAGHTRSFDEQVAWLATQTSKTAVTEFMRVAWRTVGSVVSRVWADTEALHDRFADLTRIGIDEISYRRGHFSGDLGPSLDVPSGAVGACSCPTFCVPCDMANCATHRPGVFW